MYVPVCNRFHDRQANIGKITTFMGYPYLTPSFDRKQLTQCQKFCHKKLEALRYHTGKPDVSTSPGLDLVSSCDRQTELPQPIRAST